MPAPIADLRVQQQEDRFLVSWSRPTAQKGGGALKDLAGFQLFRREILPPEEDCEECPTAYRPVTTVDLEYLQGVAVVGNRYVFTDAGLEQGKSYRYKVFSHKKDGTVSPPSNPAGRKMVPCPAPPGLRGTSSLDHVKLEWGSVLPPAQGSIEGYNIYRKESGAPGYLSPLNGTPVRETTFEDKHLEWGKRYDYAVRTVAAAGGETVESALSNEVEGVLTDTD